MKTLWDVTQTKWSVLMFTTYFAGGLNFLFLCQSPASYLWPPNPIYKILSTPLSVFHRGLVSRGQAPIGEDFQNFRGRLEVSCLKQAFMVMNCQFL